MKFKCGKCDEEFDSEMYVKCPKCGEIRDVYPLAKIHREHMKGPVHGD